MNRRIALLLTDLEIGGTPTVVRELARRLHAAGAHVEVVGLSRPGPLRDQLFALGIKCSALNAHSIRDIKVVLDFHRLIQQENIDTVFSFLLHANVIASLTRPFYPHARYFQSIQTTQPEPAWHWQLQRFAQWFADKIIVPSPDVARMAMRRAGVKADKLQVIPNAIDVKHFSHLPRPVGDPPAIGFIGRLDPIKRIPDLVQAMNRLPGVQLHIFGEGRQRTQIQDLIARLGLQSRVTLHGTTESPLSALRQFDVLVLPSRAEGFGLVLIEDMSAGIPVVAARAPGIVNVATHEQTALLVPVGQPELLANAISRLLNDTALRTRLIHNAKKHVESHYDWNCVFEQYRLLLT